MQQALLWQTGIQALAPVSAAIPQPTPTLPPATPTTIPTTFVTAPTMPDALVASTGTSKPFYAKWQTYAIAGAAVAAIGGGVMLARRRR